MLAAKTNSTEFSKALFLTILPLGNEAIKIRIVSQQYRLKVLRHLGDDRIWRSLGNFISCPQDRMPPFFEELARRLIHTFVREKR